MTAFLVLQLMLLAGASADTFLDVPFGGLALHLSVTPSEIYRLKSVDRRIVWQLTQCFSIVTVVVDPPHGGKTYGKKRTDDPVYLTNLPMMSASSRLEIMVSVRKAMKPSMNMLRNHCRKKIPLRVVILNHTKLEKTNWFDTCLLYTSPSPRDLSTSRMPSSA